MKDRALLYFGLFAGLYGVRLLIFNRIFRAAFEIPPNVSEWCAAAITYTIMIPGALFFRMLIGHEWRNTATWVSEPPSSLRLLRIAWAVITGNPWAPDPVNNVIVIASMLLAAGLVVYRFTGAAMCGLSSAFCCFCHCHHGNLRIDFGRYDPEPLGFLVLLIALGSLAAGRALERERRLKSVEHELEMARRIQHSILPATRSEHSGAGGDGSLRADEGSGRRLLRLHRRR